MTTASISHKAVRHCPLCEGKRASTLTRLHYATFDDCPLSPSFDWIICDTCGFSYYDTPSTREALDAYYRSNAYYCSTSTAGSGGSSPTERKRFEAVATLIARHLPISDKCIFDVGSGRGGLLSALRTAGFRKLYAVDMLKDCVDYIHRNLGFAALCGSAERLPFDGITPDLLIYSHVLEHVLHPRAVLDEAWNRLAEGGLVYVEVPDATRYGESSSPPYSELFLEHINHFGAAHLKMLLAACGFETVDTADTAIEIDGAASVPCLYGIFRKVPRHTVGVSFVQSLAEHLKGYLARCRSSHLHGLLETTAAAQTQLYVWGLSQYAQLLLGQTGLGRCAIKALLDGNTHKQTKTIRGKPVLPPETLRNAQSHDAVVLTGLNYRDPMRRFLQEIGFPGNEIILE